MDFVAGYLENLSNDIDFSMDFMWKKNPDVVADYCPTFTIHSFTPISYPSYQLSSYQLHQLSLLSAILLPAPISYPSYQLSFYQHPSAIPPINYLISPISYHYPPTSSHQLSLPSVIPPISYSSYHI